MKNKIFNITFIILMIIYLYCILDIEFIWLDAGWFNYVVAFVYTILPTIGGIIIGIIIKDKILKEA